MATTIPYYRDRLVFLTGGSSGIGLSAARILRRSGAHLILAARRAEALEQARASLHGEGPGELHLLPLDVGDRDAVFAAASALPSKRPVQVILNNAGVTLPGHFLDLPLDEFERQMRINYLGSVYCTRALLPGLIAQGSGHVAFVSSLLGQMGLFGYSAYAPTKFALRGFAECLRCELKPRGITVSVCYPPDTDTPQHAFELPLLPEETRACAGNAAVISADQVAEKLLSGMARGCFDILPDRSSWFATVMNRLAPGIVRATFDSDIRKIQKR